MDVLWIVAHPEPTSLTAALHREGVDELRAAGPRVTVSDLYAMRWNPVVGPGDIPEEPAPRVVTRASRRAFDRGTLAGAARFVRERVRALPDTAPLPFRAQDGGDYDDDLVLRGELATGGSGLDVHYATGTFPATERVSMLSR